MPVNSLYHFAFDLKQYHTIIVLAALCLFSGISHAEETKTMTFTTLEGTIVQKISARVVEEAYRRLGIQIKIKELPARRAISMANSGAVDGELSRIANVEKKFTSLIPIKIPVNFIEGMVLSKDKPITVDGWKSIKQYRIAIRRGVVFTKNGTKGMDVQVLNSWKAILAALRTQRVDVTVVPKTIALNLLKTDQLDNIIINEPPIISLPLFHYLHKKNSALIPQLKEVLKQMQADGSIEEILKNSRKDLASRNR